MPDKATTIKRDMTDISNDKKRNLAYMEVGFSCAALYGYLDYYLKNEDNPGLLKIFEDYYEHERYLADDYGYKYDFWFLRDMLMFTKTKRRLAFAGGNTAYAILPYVMNISAIDPFYHNTYFSGMLYGAKENRRPISQLVIPEDMGKELELYLEETYGKENIDYDGSVYSITLHGEEGEDYQVDFYLIKDYALSFAESLVREELNHMGKDFVDPYWESIFGRIDQDFILTDEMQSCLKSVELKETIKDFIQLSDLVDESITSNPDGFISSFLDGSIEGLIKIISIVKGSELWDGTKDCAAANGFWYREDVYDFCMDCLHDKRELFP